MIHAKATKPRIFPWNNDRDPEQIDRVQEIVGDLTITQEKLYEVGRVGKLGVHKQTPALAPTIRQFENGDMNFWRSLANLEDPTSASLDESVDLDDISATIFDIAAFLTDDSGSFKGTINFPKMRVSGFSINIADPDSTIERSFDLVGEDYKIVVDNYLAWQKETASGDGELTITLSPAAIEYASGKRVFKVLRVRSGEVSELIEDATPSYEANTWRYDAGDVKVQTCLTGDIVKVFYAAASAYTTLWTDNDVSAEAYYADQCDIYLKVGAGDAEKIYRIQSVTIDGTLERTDYKEVGNKEIVQTGVSSKTVTVTLGRILEDFTLEEILAGSPAYPFIDSREFSSEVTLIVKIYTDNTKSTFALGYKITDLSPTSLAFGTTVEEYDTADDTLESDNFLVTPDESEL